MSGQLNLALPSGGSVTVAAPDSASDTTVTLPAGNNTLGIQGPAFSAYTSSDLVVSGVTWTKVRCNTEEFDTASAYDNSTYRFQPSVPGYYQFNASLYASGALAGLYSAFYKNGSLFKYGSYSNAYESSSIIHNSAIIYLNGTTDYVEHYGYSTVANNFRAGNDTTYFQGVLVRAA